MGEVHTHPEHDRGGAERSSFFVPVRETGLLPKNRDQVSAEVEASVALLWYSFERVGTPSTAVFASSWPSTNCKVAFSEQRVRQQAVNVWAVSNSGNRPRSGVLDFLMRVVSTRMSESMPSSIGRLFGWLPRPHVAAVFACRPRQGFLAQIAVVGAGSKVQREFQTVVPPDFSTRTDRVICRELLAGQQHT